MIIDYRPGKTLILGGLFSVLIALTQRGGPLPHWLFFVSIAGLSLSMAWHGVYYERARQVRRLIYSVEHPERPWQP